MTSSARFCRVAAGGEGRRTGQARGRMRERRWDEKRRHPRGRGRGESSRARTRNAPEDQHGAAAAAAAVTRAALPLRGVPRERHDGARRASGRWRSRDSCDAFGREFETTRRAKLFVAIRRAHRRRDDRHPLVTRRGSSSAQFPDCLPRSKKVLRRTSVCGRVVLRDSWVRSNALSLHSVRALAPAGRPLAPAVPPGWRPPGR